VHHLYELCLCLCINFHNKYLHHPIHSYLARSLSLALILCVLRVIPQKKAFSENTYSEGALGIAQRANPGDWSPDMMKVTELSREIGGYGDKEIFQMMMLGQVYMYICVFVYIFIYVYICVLMYGY
jgi:hypothetical protein